MKHYVTLCLMQVIKNPVLRHVALFYVITCYAMLCNRNVKFRQIMTRYAFFNLCYVMLFMQCLFLSSFDMVQ